MTPEQQAARTGRLARRWLARAAGTVVVFAFAASLTLVTGFPGNGALRRYPLRDLNALADKIGTGCSPAGLRAYVDLRASRVNLPGGHGNVELSVEELAMIGHAKLPGCEPRPVT